MYRITKEFHFSASHQLSHLPDDHISTTRLIIVT